MTIFSRALLPAIAICLFPVDLLAQSITTAPLMPVPVSSPWLLLALGIALIGAMWWMQQRQALTGRGSGIAMLVLVGAAALAGALVITAQSTTIFSNPAGQTLAIPIAPERRGQRRRMDAGGLQEHSGVALLITRLPRRRSARLPGAHRHADRGIVRSAPIALRDQRDARQRRDVPRRRRDHLPHRSSANLATSLRSPRPAARRQAARP